MIKDDVHSSTPRVIDCTTTASGDCRMAAFTIHTGDLNRLTVKRTLNDLKSYSKQIQAFPGGCSIPFPMSHIKNLANRSWEHNGEGWDIHMTKSYNVMCTWLCWATSEPFNECYVQFIDEPSYVKAMEVKRETRVANVSARKYQQYFTSQPNIDFLLELVIDGISPDSEVVFIEPSCGDGRIIKAIRERSLQYRVIGCEIDGSLISNDLPGIFIGDFMLFERSSLDSMVMSSDDHKLIVLGNPPYTEGGGYGLIDQAGIPDQDTGRDLPFRFVLHSALDLRATKIAFIVPPRCSDPEYICRVKEAIECKNKSGPGFCTCIERSRCNGSWKVQTFQPPDTCFQFRGRIVRQPVIIQVWERTFTNDLIGSFPEQLST